MLRVMLAYGTRPEAIKMAPVVGALRQHPDVRTSVVVTGQHREMLDQVNGLFGIRPDEDLDLMKPGTRLNDLASRALTGMSRVLDRHPADVVVVQGDTTSAFVAGLAAFYMGVKVAHVEAGLRTGDLESPFPEEGNRRLLAPITSLHLAPTSSARNNLLGEGVHPRHVVVTGNTVIDALQQVARLPRTPSSTPGLDAILDEGPPLVLVTIHRRESWGEGTARIAAAVRRLAVIHRDTQFVLPMHRNPIVRDALVPTLRELPNVLLTEPLAYPDFVRMMAASRVVLTDSGGVQEEAPSLGVPVLVTRDTTERPEAVQAGTVRLVGTDTSTIVTWVDTLLRDESAHTMFARAVNPYGDGRAAARTVAAIRHMFGRGSRLPDFDPALPSLAQVG